MHRALCLLAGLFLVRLILPGEAKAYLDPGTGSYLIQIVVASVAALGLAAGHYRDKIKNLIFKKHAKPKTQDDA
jgi:hypothetical protein